jgi:hypothetical protein
MISIVNNLTEHRLSWYQSTWWLFGVSIGHYNITVNLLYYDWSYNLIKRLRIKV